MGWYLSDGTIEFRNGKVRAIRISQKLDGKLYNEMRKFYHKYKNKIKIGLYKYKRKPNNLNPNEIVEVTLVIFDKNITNKFYLDCNCREDKNIPRWVFNLSKTSFDILLKALMLGDGTLSRPDNSEIYYSKYFKLASSIQELAFLSGYETSLYGPYSYKRPNYPYDHFMYQIHINKTRKQFKKLIRNHNVKVQNVENKNIVCFTTPTGTLVTRYNGHIGLQGNSKHACHLVRLCRMAEEILRDGVVLVKRPDAQELLNIRQGNVPYEAIEEIADTMDAKLEALYKTCTLRDKPDHKGIQKLYKDICEEFYRIRF